MNIKKSSKSTEPSTEMATNLSRRTLLKKGLAGGALAAAFPSLVMHGNLSKFSFDVPSSEFDEITIADLQDGMKSGGYTARSIAEHYLERIDAVDKQGPALKSIIEVNPDALQIADELDKERKENGIRGPMHGIPVVIKDNIDTADKMMTTAGSLALVGSKPPSDSFVVQQLRKSGAVILARRI